MSDYEKGLDLIQANTLAYEVLLQSLYAALDPKTKAAAIKGVEDNFAAYYANESHLSDRQKEKLAVAKHKALSISGGNIQS